jgi:predicted DCC family thiol-disulfide oxidoreductase YuxK
MTDETRVLYNAQCPVCSFEIDHYRSYSTKNDLPLAFDDLNDASAREAWGISEDAAARRLYVVHAGALTSGIPAFLVLWAQMPRYRWLARIVGLPGVRQLAGATYDHVLAPAIYRWYRYRRAKAT